MIRRRTAPVLLLAIVGLLAAWGDGMRAEPAIGEPLLWEGRLGTSQITLFGTIHVPDARVLALPDRVRAALDRADRVVTEIPLDAAAQMQMASASLLPDGQSLRAILGDTRFARLETRVREAVSPATPTMAPLVAGMLDRLKPWAALAQLATLEYLPDLLEGRMALDAQLYADARAAGKQVGALESVAEQARTFDTFTADEQAALIDAALDELDAPGEAPTTSMLVQWYLEGNADKLAGALAHMPGDATLASKFEKTVLVSRNHRMADRIDAIRAQAPGESLFVAVGALHLVGPENLPHLLRARGYDIARVRR